MPSVVRSTAVAAATLAVALTATSVAAGARPAPTTSQQAELLQRSVMPASTFRSNSPPTGAFFTATNRSDAAGNGVAGPASGAYFGEQPVQGISSMVPAGRGTWWALADNGYGNRDNSADWQLVVYLIDPQFGNPGGPRLISTVLLSDPGRYIPWKIVCDPTHGQALPPLSFNVLPSSPPPACGADAARRLLTGFDFDPESIQVAADGSFWIGDEFGPFLLHFDQHGRMLRSPIPAPGAKSPQNPTLNVAAGEEPTVAASRGFEGLAINPNRTRLYPMFEGSIRSDGPQEVRIMEFDIRTQRFTDNVNTVQLEMPGGKANLTALRLVDGSLAYPNAVAPTGTGGESVAELTAVNEHQFLLLERDGAGDGVAGPRFKKVFLLDREGRKNAGNDLRKELVADLMAIPDPHHVGGDGDFFRFPFNTIESVHVVDANTILVANDNNYPFSNARSRSRTNDRLGPLAPDDNELILIGLGNRLDVDSRLLAGKS